MPNNSNFSFLQPNIEIMRLIRLIYFFSSDHVLRTCTFSKATSKKVIGISTIRIVIQATAKSLLTNTLPYND